MSARGRERRGAVSRGHGRYRSLGADSVPTWQPTGNQAPLRPQGKGGGLHSSGLVSWAPRRPKGRLLRALPTLGEAITRRHITSLAHLFSESAERPREEARIAFDQHCPWHMSPSQDVQPSFEPAPVWLRLCLSALLSGCSCVYRPSCLVALVCIGPPVWLLLCISALLSGCSCAYRPCRVAPVRISPAWLLRCI